MGVSCVKIVNFKFKADSQIFTYSTALILLDITLGYKINVMVRGTVNYAYSSVKNCGIRVIF